MGRPKPADPAWFARHIHPDERFTAQDLPRIAAECGLVLSKHEAQQRLREAVAAAVVEDLGRGASRRGDPRVYRVRQRYGRRPPAMTDEGRT